MFVKNKKSRFLNKLFFFTFPHIIIMIAKNDNILLLACRLVASSVPSWLSGPMLSYHQLDNKQHTSIKFWCKYKHFDSNHWIWKCPLSNDGYFMSVSVCWIIKTSNMEISPAATKHAHSCYFFFNLSIFPTIWFHNMLLCWIIWLMGASAPSMKWSIISHLTVQALGTYDPSHDITFRLDGAIESTWRHWYQMTDLLV